MNRNFKIFALASVVLVAMYVCWSTLFHVQTWRYKITVMIDTPEGTKTGYVVREVNVTRGIHVTPEMTANVGLKGEAVVIDLGKHGVLFGLLYGSIHGSDYGSDILFNVLPKDGAKSGLDRIPRKGKVVTLAPDQYPVFVRFPDLKNPDTIEGMTKINTGNAFDLDEKKLDVGVKLRAVTFEVTDDPVTSELPKWLPWIASKAPLDHALQLPDMYLVPRDFSRGIDYGQ